ncbi:MAG: sulfatase [Singulisphaera sp.]
MCGIGQPREFDMRDLKLASLVVGLIVLSASRVTTHAADARYAERPNILWVTTEDTGPHLGCYGHPDAVTPHLDRLAARGLRYRNAWSNAPVCAPARTAIISGVYPTSTGSEHMRSLVEMPPFMRMYPQFLRERGYYCTNNSKEDYNLEKPGKVWDESSNKAHWKGRNSGQPFFAVFNFTITHEGQIHRRPHTPKHDPARVRVPAYHPDTPEVRLDWAQYHDNITTMDAQVGTLLEELKAAGLADETIVFFYGDHGPGMPRSKRWPYNSGLNVPLIVYVPEKFKHLAPREYAAGTATDRLVSFVDLAPALLSLVGLRPPAWMQGHAFMGRFEAPPQPYLHGFRGRMDERYDLVRSVRDERYVYIRNYMPHIVYGQYLTTLFKTPTTVVWKQLYDEGKLEPPQTFFWERKPAEELYDLQADPDEVNNLTGSSEHRSILEELRRAQREQVLRVRDVGLLSEAEMHSRSDGMSIYEMGHDPERYPLERILEMAELASSLKPDSLPRLQEGLGDADAAVRYWAAMGILMRRRALRSARVAIRRALEDESPSVGSSRRALGRWR